MDKTPQRKNNILAIIITYNGAKWISKCINSLLKSIVTMDILVIDNDSADDTINIIRKEFNSVEILILKENLGFGKANNIGFKKAIDEGYEYVFLLNQDAWITDEDGIKKLVESFKSDSSLGICSPMQFKNQQDLDLKFSSYLKAYNRELYSAYRKNKLKNNLYKVKFVNAAAWLISNKCLNQVGLFAPIFKHYGEDNNFAHRAIFYGFDIAVNPQVKIIHDRPQKQMVEIETENYRKRVASLYIERLMNINHSLVFQFIYIIAIVFIKSLKTLFSSHYKKTLVPLRAFFDMTPKTKLILQQRKQTRIPQAFL